MTTFTLKLTDEQAEMLGFALTEAWRGQRDKADTFRDERGHQSPAYLGARERQHAIEELRQLLDTCPAE